MGINHLSGDDFLVGSIKINIPPDYSWEDIFEEVFNNGYDKGYKDATSEACKEIEKNYRPNER